jgi:hypothetical protein
MNTRRKFFFAAAALFVVLASIAWRIGRDDRTATSASPAGVAEHGAPIPPSSEVIERRAIANEEPAPVPQPAAPVASERVIRGRLFVDGYDKPIEDAAATIVFGTEIGLRDAPPIRRVEVTAGRFEFAVLPAETRATVLEVRVDDRPASVLTRQIALDVEGEVRVEARLGAGVLLHVVDALSRAELREVTIATRPEQGRIPSFDDFAIRCPTPEMQAEPLIEHGSSPLPLPPSAHAEPYWVTARGHEWRRILVAGQSGERTVTLGPGCELLVHLPATPPPQGGLRLVIDGAGPDAHLALQPLDPASEPSIVIAGLPPGECSASIELGRRTFECVASHALTLNVGEQTRWDVEWGALQSAPRSGLRIVVHAKLAPPREARDAKYDIVRLDTAAKSVREKLIATGVALRLDEASGDYVGFASQLGAGIYLVAVSPWGQLRTIEVVPGIDAACEFDPSTRIACTVRVVDTSGRPLPNSRVRYANVEPGRRSEHMFDATERDASGSAWRVWVEPGNVEFAITAMGSGGLRRTESVASFDQVITAELRPSAELPIAIRLMQGDAEYPIEAEDWVTVVVESGPPGGGSTILQFGSTGIGAGGASSGMTMRVSVSGTYVLRVPPVVCGGADDQFVTVEVKAPDGATVELQRRD